MRDNWGEECKDNLTSKSVWYFTESLSGGKRRFTEVEEHYFDFYFLFQTLFLAWRFCVRRSLSVIHLLGKIQTLTCSFEALSEPAKTKTKKFQAESLESSFPFRSPQFWSKDPTLARSGANGSGLNYESKAVSQASDQKSIFPGDRREKPHFI